MLGAPSESWQDRRRAATRRAILDAAWVVAHEEGLAALTLRKVAARVGMAAPSLYSHFASKQSIYDGMFGQAWQAFDDVVAATPVPSDPREALRTIARTFVEFSLADLPRHQLMDTRVIPDFTPTAEAYAPSLRVLARLRDVFQAAFGEVREEDVDLFVAMVGGLVDAQWANDPGGTRYSRLLDRAVDMFADETRLPGSTEEDR